MTHKVASTPCSPCKSNTKVPKTTPTVALSSGCIHKGQNRTWFSENNRNNTHCCSDKGVALARGGGDGGGGDINLLDPLLWGRQWDA